MVQIKKHELNITRESLRAVTVNGSFSVLFPILSPLGREMGLSEFQITSTISASPLTVFLSAPIWGRMSDLWSRKRVMLIDLFGFTLGTVIFNSVLTATQCCAGWTSPVPEPDCRPPCMPGRCPQPCLLPLLTWPISQMLLPEPRAWARQVRQIILAQFSVPPSLLWRLFLFPAGSGRYCPAPRNSPVQLVKTRYPAFDCGFFQSW
ncbi:MAG TPA: MFS transporter [Gammaproteobacteria bacterium]|nr:MFS transporter [Gammaproteobacteria bacterium]HIL98078.1 MFS transporter [Pseudomonadales bacterium]